MNKACVAAFAVLLASTPAFADEVPSAEDKAKIEATAKAWGCTGGKAEKESEATGVFELDDAKCADGAGYDLKMDKAFKIQSITAD